MKSINEKNANRIVLSTLQVSMAVVFIKALGFVKQVVIAAKFGASIETDAFFIATGVVSSLANVFFSAISVTLLSFYTQRKVTQGTNSANRLISATLKVFLPIAALLFLLFYVFAPVVAKILAPSYAGVTLEILASYVKMMAGCFIFNCYYLTLNVILESDKEFLPGKGLALFQNAFLILAAIFFSNEYGVTALVAAFVVAAALQCVLITFCARKKYQFSWKTPDCNQDIRELLKVSVPLIVGNSIYELNDIVDKQIASSQGGGAASVLSYGASLNEIVTTVIIMSLSTVLFSYYATWAANRDYERIGRNLKKAMEYLVVLIMPILVVCLISGQDIVRLMYGRGQFGDAEIRQTNGVLAGYAVGFLFQAARATIVKVFYALKNTKTPMLNGAISVASNIVLSLILSRYLGPGGIALATSIAMMLVTVLLLMQLPKYLPGFSIRSSVPEYVKALIAGIVSGIILVVIIHILPNNIIGGTLTRLAICATVTVVIYIAVVFIIRSKSAWEAYEKLVTWIKPKKS